MCHPRLQRHGQPAVGAAATLCVYMFTEHIVESLWQQQLMASAVPALLCLPRPL